MSYKKNLDILYIFLIFILALYIRLDYIIAAPFQFKIDAWSMYNYALNIPKGLYYGHAFGEHWSRYAYWPPLYIFITGFIYKLFGEGQGIAVARALQALLSALSCCIVYLLCSETVREYSRRHQEGALLAGLLMAVNPRMIVYTNHLYVETVFIFIYLLTSYLLLKYYKYRLQAKPDTIGNYPGNSCLIIASVLLGLGNLTRPILLLLPFVMSVLILMRAEFTFSGMLKALRIAVIDTAVMLAVMLAVISPWTLRNYFVTGRVILIDTNGPINFYIAHNPLANGIWVDVKPHTDLNRLYTTGYSDGMHYLLQHPEKELRLAITKQNMIFKKGDPHIDEGSKYLDKSLKILSVPLPKLSIAALWSMSGILLLAAFFKLAAIKKAGLLLKEPAWLIGNILYIDFIIVAFYFMPRYRIIIEPFLITLIGVCCALLANTVRAHTK